MKQKDMPGRVEPWTLTQLHEEFQKDLKALYILETKEEITKEYKKDLAALAFKINKEGRNFTPMEMVILISAINL